MTKKRRTTSFAANFKPSLPKMEEEGTWSLLPELLLWMIKDKLDIFDNMRVAAVCHGWRSASVCYPKKLQSVGDGVPWIMQSSKDIKSSAREFFSITRNQKFTVDLPEFSEATVVFSKQGWLLLQRPNFSKSGVRFSKSFFLINVFTKSKIKMPDAIASEGVYCGSFSTVEGYPNFVVLLDRNFDQVTFWVAYPGDEAWTKHSNLGQRMCLEGVMYLVTFGQDVYCFDWFGNMITYNISSHLWKEILGLGKQLSKGYVMEHEGKIVILVHNDGRSLSLFRYSDVDATWERSNIEDEKESSWFLSRTGISFSAKDKGLKVYALHPRICPNSYERCVVSVRCLMTTHGRQLPYQLSFYATWVDIG